MRLPNNPNAIDTLLPILQVILPGYPTANTLLAQMSQSQTGVERIYIEEKAKLVKGPFPAVLLTVGSQSSKLSAQRAFDDTVIVHVIWYDRWDRQTSTIDVLHKNARQDLERMKSNLQSNNTLAYQGQNHALALPLMTIGEYEEELDSSLPGVTLVRCTLTLQINSLPYLV